MERIRKSRTVQRGAFTRIANQLSALIAVASPAVPEIRAAFEMLQGKQDALRELDSQIYDSMLENDASEEDLGLEVHSADEYLSVFTNISVRCRTIGAEPDGDDGSARTTVSSRTNGGGRVLPNPRNFKLPKIELRRFGGDIRDWLPFWSQFKKINDDPDIAEEDKFQYLMQATVPGSRAQELVDSFPPTAENYAKVIESLKSRFGREELQVEVYVRELLKLVLDRAYLQNGVPLVSLYDRIETQLRALESLGVTTEKCAAMLYPLVESCLSEELLRVWQRSSHFTQNLNAQTINRLEELMTFLKAEVESEERVRMAAEGFGKLGHDSTAKKGRLRPADLNTPTALGLINTQLPKCIFCDGVHESEDCFKAQKMANQEKHHVLRSRGACFVCLRLGHLSRKCKAQVRCYFCGKRHFILLCPELPKYQSSVSDERGEEESSEESSRNTEQALANKTHSYVFLQTLRVKIRSESREREVRALIDTGSQRSYVLASTAVGMKYSAKRNEKMTHALFGGTHSPEENHSCYDLRLSSLDGKYACHFEAFDQTNICDSISAIYDGRWLKELEKLRIRPTDVKDSAKIEVLIGADVAGKLLTGKRHLLKCGVVAVETLLGWTLMGKVPDVTPRNSSTMAVTSLFSREIKVSEFWRLDGLGISDPGRKKSTEEKEAAVGQHLMETVKIDEDDQYQTQLPWLDGYPPLPTNFKIAKKKHREERDNELQVYRHEASQLMVEDQFELRWREFSSVSKNVGENQCPTNVLDMEWDKTSDTLAISAISQRRFSNHEKTVHKRQILSAGQCIFNSIGFTAPATVTFNSLLQKMWQEKTDLGELRKVFIKKSGRAVVIGEIVIIGSDNKKRPEWPLGRVVDLRPSHYVRVKTTQGCLLRPIQRLFPLECVPMSTTTSDPGEDASMQPSTSDTRPSEEDDVVFSSGVKSRDSGQRAKVTRCGRRVKLHRKFAD